MQCLLSPDALADLVTSQVNRLFPDGSPVDRGDVSILLPRVLERLEVCFSGLINPGFKRGGGRFDHLHSEHYAVFLYLLGNEAWRAGSEESSSRLATKSYLLNKALHSLEVFYEIGLPPVFWLAHPVGTVLGRARYGNGFAAMQGCTVGNKGGAYPSFGERVVMCAGSGVFGDCRVGNDVCFGAGALIIDAEIPDGSTVVGRGADLRIIEKRSPLIESVFHASLFR